jgi:organic hydroperoxide reductase OsmC/OhrA
MLGTLNGALEVRQVKLEGDAIRATVEGVNEVRDGLVVLTEVRVRYFLRIPKSAREVVDRALARHQDRCPTAAWMKPVVRVSWSAEIEEE